MKISLPWAKPKDNYAVAFLFILGSELLGIGGTFFTVPAIPSWYSSLNKPFFAPPNWLFGPVWTLLYACIGLSAYLVWRKYKFRKISTRFWTAFITQFVLNIAWTPIFFGLKWVGAAYIVILGMAMYIFRTIIEAKKIDVRSAGLLYPYLAWVIFASFLNLAIYLLN